VVIVITIIVAITEIVVIVIDPVIIIVAIIAAVVLVLVVAGSIGISICTLAAGYFWPGGDRAMLPPMCAILGWNIAM